MTLVFGSSLWDIFYYLTNTLREKCHIKRFFWSAFSRIRIEYRDLRSKCPYSVRIEENTDDKNLRIWTLFTECYVHLGLQKHVFLIKSDIRHFFVRSGYVWKLHHKYVASWFVNLLYLFLPQNYVINSFLTMTYFSWR